MVSARLPVLACGLDLCINPGAHGGVFQHAPKTEQYDDDSEKRRLTTIF